jgi:transcriptional antiterminator Rof (Rho-off)
MSHVIERCDVLDVLEESARLHRSVQVQLKDGRHFVDRARDVVTADDGEWAVFRGELPGQGLSQRSGASSLS